MKKVTIMGFGTGIVNYGTVLMSLAVQRTLRHFGVQGYLVKEIDYSALPDKSILKKINPKKKRSSHEWINEIFLFLYEYEVDKRMFKKRLRFINFERKYLKSTRACFSKNDIEDEIKRIHCPAVMIESDCVWHPYFLRDEWTLNFNIPGLYRFSYAPSMMVSSLSEEQKIVVRRFEQDFKRINRISVREKSGADLLKELTGVESEVVCDPVMLLTPRQWQKYMSKPIVTGKYLFCYIIEDNLYANKRTVEIAKLLHVNTIVYVRVGKVENGYGDMCGIKNVILNDEVGPSEFLRLMNDAVCICTDSFHAMNFSIIFNKQFFAFERQNKCW